MSRDGTGSRGWGRQGNRVNRAWDTRCPGCGPVRGEKSFNRGCTRISLGINRLMMTLLSRSGRQTGAAAGNIRVHPRASAVETLFFPFTAVTPEQCRPGPGSPDCPGMGAPVLWAVLVWFRRFPDRGSWRVRVLVAWNSGRRAVRVGAAPPASCW